jgi:ATP-dependent phosphofructokinase / diphosphate-dependent phosphofructokinase
MRIGVLTGGGDCPGLNAAIRAIVRVAESAGDQIIGFHHGWRGVVEADGAPLTTTETKGILQSGGTVLRTARYHPDEYEGGTSAVLRTVARDRLDALIVIGGDGTLACANRLTAAGIPIVGVPKTIDNDVEGTTRCIGFDTAVATAADAIDRVHTTGESHDRLMVIEVMGRSAGWLAVSAGIAGGADAICTPERPTSLDELAKAIQRRHDGGSFSSVVVVAEGARFLGAAADDGSAGRVVSKTLEECTGYETRLTVLGQVQRGGSPSAADRLLATGYGVAALDAVHERAFGSMVCARGDTIELTSLEHVAASPRLVPNVLLDLADRLTVQP